jgi:hypothetical protein
VEKKPSLNDALPQHVSRSSRHDGMRSSSCSGSRYHMGGGSCFGSRNHVPSSHMGGGSCFGSRNHVPSSGSRNHMTRNHMNHMNGDSRRYAWKTRRAWLGDCRPTWLHRPSLPLSFRVLASSHACRNNDAAILSTFPLACFSETPCSRSRRLASRLLRRSSVR